MKYQVNPNSVSFKDMEVVGFVRDTAEYGTTIQITRIGNCSMPDKSYTLMEKSPLILIKKDMVC